MPKLGSILTDLADLKGFLGTVVTVGGIVLAQIKPFGIPELDQIIGYVLAAAAFGITVINAYITGFGTAQTAPRRG